MLFGNFPPVFNNVFAFKTTGVASQGSAVVGPHFSQDVNQNNKNNRTGTVFGDFSYTPTVYSFISDPEVADAPLAHYSWF